MRGIFILICVTGACLAGGCASEQQQPQNKFVEKPAFLYEGLKGHNCAVMVWADWRTRTEYNQIQIDLAKLLTKKLEDHFQPKKEGKKQEPPSVQFTNPASVVRYQREHPEVMSMPIVEVAPRLQAERVVFVELEEFTAHSPEAVMVLKGHAKATLRVIEVSGDTAKVAFEEMGITARFPPDQPEGVIASDTVNVRTIYDGALNLLAEKLAARFK
jgi:nucleoside diphosphate kinase